MEQGSEAVRLDRDGRIHHGETLPLPADVGEDPTRLHQPPEPETKEVAVHLFVGHYNRSTKTSCCSAQVSRPRPRATTSLLPAEVGARSSMSAWANVDA